MECALNVVGGGYHSTHVLVAAYPKDDQADAAIFAEFVKSYVPLRAVP